MKKSSTNGMNCSLDPSNLGQNKTQCVKMGTLLIPPEQRQQNGQISYMVLLLIFNLRQI